MPGHPTALVAQQPVDHARYFSRLANASQGIELQNAVEQSRVRYHFAGQVRLHDARRDTVNSDVLS